MLWQITSLALVDAVNPCTLAVQAMLLGALLLTKGRREAIVAGILFTFTIFLMYLLYGLGILQIIYALGIEKVIEILLKLLLLVMVVVELNAYFNYRPGMVSMEMPMVLRPFAKRTIGAVSNPVMAVPVAALCSVLLLPCSSGPYVAALMILARYSIARKILFLLYYCAIFVLPMLIITGIVAVGTSPEKVMEWRNKHIKELHLVAGILLLSVLLLL